METTQNAVQHTPGPWEIGNIGLQCVHERLQPMYQAPIHFGNGNCHTIVFGGGAGALHSDKASVAANARLIAAAPDMLAALQALWNGGYLITFSGDEAESDIKRAAIAAIRKATEPA